ncbi:hypothetical protein NL676_006134 [Syzygium grande]|nr:hypothetical protein NL676_006134 [Syzygium grande]
MASVSAFVASHSIVDPAVSPRKPRLPFRPRARSLQFQVQARKKVASTSRWSSGERHRSGRMRILRSSEEEGAPVAEAQVEEGAASASSSSSSSAAAEQQTVSVPVSPSDTLTMFFQAEGTMSESAIPAVTTALEGAEGIATLKVQVVEGIASVELTKQTTIQATGVASSLVETIQGAGFKLQTLNLSFEEEEEVHPWKLASCPFSTKSSLFIPNSSSGFAHRRQELKENSPPAHTRFSVSEMAFKAFVFVLLALLLLTVGSSTKAAAYEPGKPPGAVYPPVKAPIAQPPVKLYGCVAPCEELCKKDRKKRPCMKACTTCCKKCNKCVPLGYSKCPGWDFVYIHGVRTACP